MTWYSKHASVSLMLRNNFKWILFFPLVQKDIFFPVETDEYLVIVVARNYIHIIGY